MPLLVENRSKTGKPDLWMICLDDFTEDELKPHRRTLRKLRIKPLQHGVKCRIDRLFPKDALLKFFEQKAEKTE